MDDVPVEWCRSPGAGNWQQHSGPGHHAFFRSPDGTEDWMTYHAKTTSVFTYSDRTTRAQKIGWRTDGS